MADPAAVDPVVPAVAPEGSADLLPDKDLINDKVAAKVKAVANEAAKDKVPDKVPDKAPDNDRAAQKVDKVPWTTS